MASHEPQQNGLSAEKVGYNQLMIALRSFKRLLQQTMPLKV